MQATLRLLQSSEAPISILRVGPTHVKACTIHSYHTRVSSVCLHMLTSSSVSSGKYSGCCHALSVSRCLRAWYAWNVP